MRTIRRPDFFGVTGAFRVVSSAPWNGGFRSTRTIVNVRVQSDFNEDVGKFFRAFQRRTGFGSLVGLLTAVNVHRTVVRRSRAGTVAVTAGVSNASRIGTINVIVILRGRPTPAAMVEAVKVVTEAKVTALRRLDVRAGPDPATGTSTDAVVIACEDRGPPWEYCGSATTRGRALGSMVARAVAASLARGESLRADRPIATRLAERGWSPSRVARAGRSVALTDRKAWEARLAVEDAVRAGRLSRRAH